MDAQDDDEFVGKGEFAQRIDRTAARVSQYIAEGKLSAPALTPDGRVNVRLGKLQLASVLDPSQQVAQTKPILPGSTAGETAENAGLLKARRENAELDAETKRRKLNAEKGIYSLTADAERAVKSELAEAFVAIDAWISEEGKALALEHGLDERRVVIHMRAAFKAFRAKQAASRRDAAAGLPEFVPEAAAIAAE
jgi:hypothetical protein